MRKLDDIPLKPTDRAAILDAARPLRERFPVTRILLFGSKARGDDDAESDIDLLLILAHPIDRSERHAITRALSDLGRHHGVVFSTRPVAEEAWENGMYRVLPLRHEVDEDGVVVDGRTLG